MVVRVDHGAVCREWREAPGAPLQLAFRYDCISLQETVRFLALPSSAPSVGGGSSSSQGSAASSPSNQNLAGSAGNGLSIVTDSARCESFGVRPPPPDPLSASGASQSLALFGASSTGNNNNGVTVTLEDAATLPSAWHSQQEDDSSTSICCAPLGRMRCSGGYILKVDQAKGCQPTILSVGGGVQVGSESTQTTDLFWMQAYEYYCLRPSVFASSQ